MSIYIYDVISDTDQIINHTILNIIKGIRNNKGSVYIDHLNISFLNVDAKNTLLEIYNQCIKNNIKLFIQIRLINNEILTIKT